MLTAIEIQNFKAFGDTQRIELRPVTLLFGPNSGGKSSIIHALHYARELLLGRSCDVHRTESGADLVDLGGINRLVHGRQLDGRPITIRLEMDLTDQLINLGFESIGDELAMNRIDNAPLERVTRGAITLCIPAHKGAIVEQFIVELNGISFAVIETTRGKPDAEIGAVNWAHPILIPDELTSLLEQSLLPDMIEYLGEEYEHYENPDWNPVNMPGVTVGPDDLGVPRKCEPFEELLMYLKEGDRDRGAYYFTQPKETRQILSGVFPASEPMGRDFHSRKIVRQVRTVDRVFKMIKHFRNKAVHDHDPGRHSVPADLKGTLMKAADLIDGFATTDVNEFGTTPSQKADLTTLFWQTPHAAIAKAGSDKRRILTNTVFPDASRIPMHRTATGLPNIASDHPLPLAEAEVNPGDWHTIAFNDLLSSLILGPAKVALKSLEDLHYLGPLRTIPGRHEEPPPPVGSSRWPNGIGAWDRLATADNKLIDRINEWLEEEELLDTGYRLHRSSRRWLDDDVIRRLAEEGPADEDEDAVDLPESAWNAVSESLQETKVSLFDIRRGIEVAPCDVGVGLSQVIPAIVAALDTESKLVAMEQPELHLHPRQQAALGDLLIEGALTAGNEKRNLIIETHSEHLILRLLRRIRETTEKRAPKGFELKPTDVRVLHVSSGDGSQAKVNVMRINTKGDLIDPWPDDFFDQDYKERFA